MLNERYVVISQLVKAYPNPFETRSRLLMDLILKSHRGMLFRSLATPVAVNRPC